MDVIRDDGGTVITPSSWASAEEFLEPVKYQAGQFRLDRTLGQKTRLVVICEAGGMAPQLGRVCDPFTIKVMSGGGFDSLTDKHNFAAALAAEDRPVEVLHIGDHDPSGVSMFLAFLEDVEAFTRDFGGDATFTRLAVTPGADRRSRPAYGAAEAHRQSRFQWSDLPRPRHSPRTCWPTSCYVRSRSVF